MRLPEVPDGGKVAVMKHQYRDAQGRRCTQYWERPLGPDPTQCGPTVTLTETAPGIPAGAPAPQQGDAERPADPAVLAAVNAVLGGEPPELAALAWNVPERAVVHLVETLRADGPWCSACGQPDAYGLRPTSAETALCGICDSRPRGQHIDPAVRERIKGEVLARPGMTQRELAAMYGIDQGTVNRMRREGA